MNLDDFNPTSPSAIVRALRDQYVAEEGRTPQEINTGMCFDFAEQLEREHPDMFECEGFGNYCNHDTSKGEDFTHATGFVEYWMAQRGWLPPEGMTYDDLFYGCGFRWDGTHAWAYCNHDGLCYDIENVEGVKNVFDLAFLQRRIQKWRSTQLNEDVEVENPERSRAFAALADAQRGDPEDAMLRVQFAMGGGILSPTVEHVGDLTHRMAQKPDSWIMVDSRGYELVKDKVEKTLRWLTQPYGFEREMEGNIKANARYNIEHGRIGSEEEFRKRLDSKLAVYADEHRKLRVYNLAQLHARQAAVCLGLKRWDRAVSHLRALQTMLRDKETWVEAASQFDPNFEAQSLRESVEQTYYHGTARDNLDFHTDRCSYWTTDFEEAKDHAVTDTEHEGGTPFVIQAKLDINPAYVEDVILMQDLHFKPEEVAKLEQQGYNAAHSGTNEMCVFGSQPVRVTKIIPVR